MNKIKFLTSLLLTIGILACSSKPEPNLELFSAEAFAFDVGDMWEVNATVNAKGFAQFDLENNPKVDLYYKVSLITPAADTIKALFDKNIKMIPKEEVAELPLEAQIELDSSFTAGAYTLLFDVSDEISQQNKIIEVKFNLEY